MSFVSIPFLGKVAIGLPLFGFTFAILWSILFHFEASNRTVCHVFNFLPTVSSAIGGFTPQRYVWRVCISLQAGLRFLLAFCYYKWHLRVHMGDQHWKYERLVELTVCCHVIENLALVILTAISSTDNSDIHEYSFVTFMITSQVYMILSCYLINWTFKSGCIEATNNDWKWLKRKVCLQIFNLLIFLVALLFYFRHNAYCEPYIYTWFALSEYLVILSNIAFHGICCADFSHYSFTIVHTEDITSGRFKNS